MARIRLLFILNGIAVAAFGPFAAVILESRGFETTQIGLLIAMTSVAAVLSITVWGHVGDVVLGRARTLRIAILGAAALLALFMLPFPLALVAALYVGYAAFNGAVGPLSDALAVNALRDPGRQYGKVRALRERLVHRRRGDLRPPLRTRRVLAVGPAVRGRRGRDRRQRRRAAGPRPRHAQQQPAGRRGPRGAVDPAGAAAGAGRGRPGARRRVRRVHVPLAAHRRARGRRARGRAVVGGRGRGRGRAR